MAKTFTDVDALKEELSESIHTCLSYDRQELREGLAKTWHIDCPHRHQITEIAWKQEDRLEEVWKDFLHFYESCITPRRFIQDDMDKKTEQWRLIGSGAGDISTQIDSHLMMPEWTGSGSELYRQHAKEQESAMEDVKNLANNAAEACSKVRLLHDIIFAGLCNAFISALAQMKSNELWWGPRSVTKEWFESHPQFTYYERTTMCITVLTWLIGNLHKVTLDGTVTTQPVQEIEQQFDQVEQGLQKLQQGAPSWPTPGEAPSVSLVSTPVSSVPTASMPTAVMDVSVSAPPEGSAKQARS